MDKKQLIRLIHEQRPEPPKDYETHIAYQLARLSREEHIMYKHYKFSTILVVAMLMAAILAGAAFAANEWHIFSLLFGQTAINEAEERVVFDIGTCNNGIAALTVEEAIYDGNNVAAVLRISPADPDNFSMLSANWGLEDINEDTFIIKKDIDGKPTSINHKDGNQIIYYSPILSINGMAISNEVIDTQTEADGSAIISIKYTLSEQPASAEIECTASALIYSETPTDYIELPEISFKLKSINDDQLYELIPSANCSDGLCEINAAYISFAKVAAYLTVDYTYTDTAEAAYGIEWRVADKNGNLLRSTDSATTVYGSNVYRQITEIQTLDEIPEFMYIEAKVIGEDRILERIECALSEITTSIPSTPFGDSENLSLCCDNTLGKHVKLVDSHIINRNTIELTYEYDGSKMDSAKIEVLYKDAYGAVIGNTITSTGIIGETSNKLTETLDNAQWPDTIIVEFMLNNNIIDTFELVIPQS